MRLQSLKQVGKYTYVGVTHTSKKISSDIATSKHKEHFSAFSEKEVSNTNSKDQKYDTVPILLGALLGGSALPTSYTLLKIPRHFTAQEIATELTSMGAKTRKCK